MCLAIPAKVISRKQDIAQVDFGEGVLREVNVALVDVKVGNYVLVHAGYAIQVLDKKEALETISLWNEILARHICKNVEAANINFLVHETVPPGDGGLSFGQAVASGFFKL